MNRREGLVVGLGFVVGVAGLVMAFVPRVAPDIEVHSVAIAVVALLALGLTAYLLRRLFGRDHESVALPTPEGRSHATPGDDIDRQIGTLSGIPARHGSAPLEPAERHDEFRRRLERTAVWVLARDASEEARESLAAGTWTDDARAAAFFSDPLAAETSVRERLHSLRTGEPTVRNRARHAIAALARHHADAEPPSDPPTTLHEGDETHSRVAVTQEPPSFERLADGEAGEAENVVGFPDRGATDRRTNRWQGVSALALVAGAAGMVVDRRGVLLGSVVGVGMAAYVRTAAPPTIELDIERTVSDADPAAGDAVDVTLTVRNGGTGLLADCAILDGVPPGLVVTEGSPRHGAALRPGTSSTFSYTIEAARGEHTFDPVAVVARDFSASAERLTRVEASGATTITCVPRLVALDSLWLRARAERFGGRVTTDATGGGVEFHATREYRPGDPRSRIDWNRLAKTGERFTLEFRAERRATVVLVIDARDEARLSSGTDEPSAVDRSVEAAGRILATLLDAATSVGVAGVSSAPEACWLPPGAGAAHRRRARTLLATHPVLAGSRHTNHGTDGDPRRPFERLRRRLPPDAEAVVVTPLCDDAAANAVRRLDALGYLPTVVSPDPTTLDSAGRQLAHVERAHRITALRSAAIPVLDWHDDPLSVAFERLRARWRSRTEAHGVRARRP